MKGSPSPCPLRTQLNQKAVQTKVSKKLITVEFMFELLMQIAETRASIYFTKKADKLIFYAFNLDQITTGFIIIVFSHKALFRSEEGNFHLSRPTKSEQNG